MFMPYANIKGTDQHAHPCSLISAFVFCSLDSILPLISISKISSLHLASVAVQAGSCLTWSQTPKTNFLVTRLIWYTDYSDYVAYTSTKGIHLSCGSSFCFVLCSCMGLIMRKPVFGVCDQARLKPACSATETI